MDRAIRRSRGSSIGLGSDMVYIYIYIAVRLGYVIRWLSYRCRVMSRGWVQASGGACSLNESQQRN